MSRNQITRAAVPAPAAPSGCTECGHPLTLHSNGRTPCKAAGCTAGPEGAPCAGFAARAEKVPELLAS